MLLTANVSTLFRANFPRLISRVLVRRLLLWSSHLFLNQRPAKENHHLRTRGQWRSPAQKSAGSYSHPWALRGIPNCVSIKKICGQGAVRTFPVYVLEQAYRLMPMICQALAPLAFGRNEQLWNGSLWRILLKKSFPADERFFLEPLMCFTPRREGTTTPFKKTTTDLRIAPSEHCSGRNV